MTCIVGVAHNGKVWIGGDSIGVSGYTGVVRRDQKVFRVGRCLIGYTSSFRMGQILRFRLDPDVVGPRLASARDVFRFLATDFVDEVRRALKDGGFATKNQEAESGGSFLLGCRGRLFEICSYYQVAECGHDYAATGAGLQPALGSLHTTDRLGWPPRRRILAALRAATEFSTVVRPPFIVRSCE